MPMSAKKRSPKSVAARAPAAKPAEPANINLDAKKKDDAGSKQVRVIAMLESPAAQLSLR